MRLHAEAPRASLFTRIGIVKEEDMKELYGIDDLVERWGVSRSTVYRIIDQAGIEFLLIGERRRVIPRAAVLAYERSRSQVDAA